MKTAIELQQLADICEERGDYVKAARLHKKALQSAERTYGVEASEMVSYVYNVGMISLALDDNQGATQQFSRLLQLFERNGGETNDVEEVQQLLYALQKNILAANA
jgi:hypothetical protein